MEVCRQKGRQAGKQAGSGSSNTCTDGLTDKKSLVMLYAPFTTCALNNLVMVMGETTGT